MSLKPSCSKTPRRCSAYRGQHPPPLSKGTWKRPFFVPEAKTSNPGSAPASMWNLSQERGKVACPAWVWYAKILAVCCCCATVSAVQHSNILFLKNSRIQLSFRAKKLFVALRKHTVAFAFFKLSYNSQMMILDDLKNWKNLLKPCKLLFSFIV